MSRLAGLYVGILAFLFSSASYSNPIRIDWAYRDPGLGGLYTGIYFEGLKGVPVTGWDLRVKWSKYDVTGDEIGIDFWFFDNFYRLYSRDDQPTVSFSSDQDARVFENIVRAPSYLSGESKAKQLDAWDYWGGRLVMSYAVFATTGVNEPNCGAGCEPRHLSFSGSKIYGEGGKLLYYVPEPSSLALFGLGLAGLGFAKRRKLN